MTSMCSSTLIEKISFSSSELNENFKLRTTERWNNTVDYPKAFERLVQDLPNSFDQGSSGQEKCMVTRSDLTYVLKFPGQPEEQNWQEGIQSIFEEYHASIHGLAGNRVMADSLLLIHETGIPILIQEKLTQLTNKINSELALEMPWLPKTWYSYAQVGRNSRSEWRFYDLDAGTSFDFLNDEKRAIAFEEFRTLYYS